MGFDALDISLVQKLQDHSAHIKNYYTTIDLKAQKLEVLESYNVYQETFPYWAGPHAVKSKISDFRIGNRVMNLNSTLRKYVPFGARGTIVGKTEQMVIVMFDE